MLTFCYLKSLYNVDDEELGITMLLTVYCFEWNLCNAVVEDEWSSGNDVITINGGF